MKIGIIGALTLFIGAVILASRYLFSFAWIKSEMFWRMLGVAICVHIMVWLWSKKPV